MIILVKLFGVVNNFLGMGKPQPGKRTRNWILTARQRLVGREDVRQAASRSGGMIQSAQAHDYLPPGGLSMLTCKTPGIDTRQGNPQN
jgi:hypothetical protein